MAALASQVLAVSQEARGPSALERQPGVDEGRRTAVMVHKERLHMYTQEKTVTCGHHSFISVQIRLNGIFTVYLELC